MDARTGRLFERAAELAPDSGRALFFAAVAAQDRNDTALAVQRFEKLLTFDPPAEVRSIIEAQVAALRSGRASVAADKAAPRVVVAVSVAPSMASRIAPGSTLFVFVRAPGRPGPPLAVKRLPAALPATIELTPADSMVPGMSFAAGDAVEVSAKLSADGSATPKAGDPVGRVAYTVGRDGTRPLVIDGVTP